MKQLRSILFPLLVLSLGFLLLHAQSTSFHNAPKAAQAVKNPYAGKRAAVSAGKGLYASDCASCHGDSGEGTGNVPPLTHSALRSIPDGAIFWYITKGDLDNGMPPWE